MASPGIYIKALKQTVSFGGLTWMDSVQFGELLDGRKNEAVVFL